VHVLGILTIWIII